MPDQNSAATEHALIQEISEPLFALPDDPVQLAAERDFPVVMRGYDRVAVDAYVADTTQLVAELQATRSPEAAVRRALEQVGEEVSSVLQRAHDTGDQLTERSRAEAEDRLERARVEAEEIQASALQTVTELDAETDRIWAERRKIVEDVETLSRRLVALAESAIQRFPAEEAAPEPDEPVSEAVEEAATEAVEEPATEAVEEEPATEAVEEPIGAPFDVEDESVHTEVRAPMPAEPWPNFRSLR